MTESIEEYPLDAQPQGIGRRNRRARLVCLRCHDKKIKCDLDRLGNNTSSRPCTHCSAAGSHCQLRTSRRGFGRRRPRTKNSGQEPDSQSQTGGDRDSDSIEAQLQPSPPQELPSLNPANTIVFGDAAESIHPTIHSGVRDCDVNGRANHNSSVEAQHEALPFQAHRPISGSGTLDSRPIQHGASAILAHDGRMPHSQIVSGISAQDTTFPSFFGDTGFMQIFRHDGSTTSPFQISALPASKIDMIIPALQESYIDTFFEYCHTWCPILDKDLLKVEPVRNSLLLSHALALVGGQINPPLIEHAPPAQHYARCKELFYGNHERNPVIRIVAIMLFYWWSAGAPNVVSMDTNWWWTGTAIRLSQELGLHRKEESTSLGRRIWWTLYCRERITAISQGRPCIIDPDECDVPMPSIDDFPGFPTHKSQIFISWVQLCEILGRMRKAISCSSHRNFDPAPFSQELIAFIQSLPSSLQLPIQNRRTDRFDRDVHNLHLTYLTSITLLHLNKSAQPIPRASVAAIASASCVARIFQDYLARGSVRFHAGQAGWYITIAILTLLHARRIRDLTTHSNAEIRTLRTALRHMSVLWHSAKMFEVGIDQLLVGEQNPRQGLDLTAEISGELMEELNADGIVNWVDYFPFITAETSDIINTLFAVNGQEFQLNQEEWTFDLQAQLQEFLTNTESSAFDILNI